MGVFMDEQKARVRECWLDIFHGLTVRCWCGRHMPGLVLDVAGHNIAKVAATPGVTTERDGFMLGDWVATSWNIGRQYPALVVGFDIPDSSHGEPLCRVMFTADPPLPDFDSGSYEVDLAGLTLIHRPPPPPKEA